MTIQFQQMKKLIIIWFLLVNFSFGCRRKPEQPSHPLKPDYQVKPVHPEPETFISSTESDEELVKDESDEDCSEDSDCDDETEYDFDKKEFSQMCDQVRVFVSFLFEHNHFLGENKWFSFLLDIGLSQLTNSHFILSHGDGFL